MKYDIFISYSRKDTAIADKICSAFDSVGITYFIDRQSIGGGLEFPVEIADAIINSEIFLLLASANSYTSKFTTKEIVFAFNKKQSQEILPYRIDDTPLPLQLEFVFADVNWRSIVEHPIEPTLIDDVLKLLGRYKSSKIYRIGDFYNDGKKQGVVFEVSEDGKRGKIVSIQEAKKQLWTSDSEECGRLIGADDECEGVNNMDRVKLISDWQNKYPAFAWCVYLGEDWYLPAVGELKTFIQNEEVRKSVNRTLDLFGVKVSSEQYWSSTESPRVQDCFGRYSARFINTGCRLCYDTTKNTLYSIRAVSLFGKCNNTHHKELYGNIYKVGDFYDDGSKSGIVFDVSASGKHGKIVSIDETLLPWCSTRKYKDKILVGALSQIDGKRNINVILNRKDCVEFEAFNWCRNKGKDWYLPTKEELDVSFLWYNSCFFVNCI